MTREANFERLLTALRCGTPDYVPLVELGIHQKIKDAYLGRPVNTLQDEIDFALAAGYDYVTGLGSPLIHQTGIENWKEQNFDMDLSLRE